MVEFEENLLFGNDGFSVVFIGNLVRSFGVLVRKTFEIGVWTLCLFIISLF